MTSPQLSTQAVGPPSPLPMGTSISAFAADVSERYGIDVSTYGALHRWSVAEPEQYWGEVWRFFDVRSSRRFDTVLDSRTMPGARWFDGAHLNYVDQVLRHDDGRTTPAIVVLGEGRDRREVSWPELRTKVSAFAQTLRSAGVVPGDRVVGYLPNADEAIIAFLGSAAVGAVWAACAPDYGASAATDRLQQLEPAVLVGVTATSFGGVLRDRRDVLLELSERLRPDVVVVVSRGELALAPPADHGARWMTWDDAVTTHASTPELRTEQVDAGHPLWVLFSSGTTGVPKGIVHGHAGVLVTHLAALGLHQDLGSGDVLFWYTTTNWMLWNIVVAALLLGVTTVAYEGSPAHPSLDVLWEIVEDEHVTQFGTSPGMLQAAAAAGLRPGQDHDLTSLRAVLLTGAPAPEPLYAWAREAISPDVPLWSTSGGTDVVSSFLGASPGVPVRPGRLPGPLLGVAVESWDEQGRPHRDRVGELVVTVPMPSMPVAFWNDPDGSRYGDAYFDRYPGVWRHGDWVTHAGDGSFIVHGRSDATLNRNGVRIGSADLYAVVESVEGIAEALVLGVERADGTYRMPMFLVPAEGCVVDAALTEHIAHRLRTECSPRHVPDEFHVVDAIPHTKTGKKLEVPLKRILQGADPDEVLSHGAVDQPELIDHYVALERSWSHGRGTVPDAGAAGR